MLRETPADDNEVRILECQALVLRTAGTQALHEGFFQEHVVVDSRCEAANKQIICNLRFQREIKLVRL